MIFRILKPNMEECYPFISCCCCCAGSLSAVQRQKGLLGFARYKAVFRCVSQQEEPLRCKNEDVKFVDSVLYKTQYNLLSDKKSCMISQLGMLQDKSRWEQHCAIIAFPTSSATPNIQQLEKEREK